MTNLVRSPREMASRSHHLSVLYKRITIGLLVLPALLIFPVSILPPWSYLFWLAAARLAWLEAETQSQKSRRAENGAIGEDEVYSILRGLESEGWAVQRNLLLQRLGDVDFLVKSPNGRSYIIDAKSHQGEVGWNGTKLYLLKNNLEVLFEKDFLAQAMRQAIATKEALNLSFVVGIVVFSRARILPAERKFRGIHVLGKDELLKFLRAEDAEHLNARSLIYGATTSATRIMSIAEPVSGATPSVTHTFDSISSAEASVAEAVHGASKGTLELSKYLQQPFDKNLYEYQPYRCWKCKKAMLAFNWRGHALHDTNAPVQPRPASVQLRWSKMVGYKYWANVCLNCDAIQGDFFVFEEIDSPDWHFSVEGASIEIR